MKISLYFLIISAAIFSCSSQKKESQTMNSGKNVGFPNVVMYEIFVQSFVDSNGDGIGDIKGMTSKLDYLQDLGIKGIWLMPIMPSPSYHKYDVTDYLEIHPDYGTMDDFKTFVSEAHKRDIKIVIDMIINHTSNHHPWFEDSKSGKDAKFRDYYVWASEGEIEKFSSLQKEATGDSYNITQWHDTESNDEKYYGFFTGMMPDLNYDNAKVREEVIEISRFWIEDIGIDGLRLDAARHIYEDSRVEDNENWWKDYKTALERYNPDIYLVGEVWAKTEDLASFLHGLPALFNFDLAFSMLESVKREKSSSAFISGHAWEVDSVLSFEQGYINNQQIYRNETEDFEDAVFLSNHDQNRILSVLEGDLNKGKLAASLLLTMPGTPYIYYGEEIGMLGMKPDPNIREPFLWDNQIADKERASWIEAEFSTDQEVTPLVNQLDDPSSIYHHYRNLIHKRNNSDVLSYGEFVNATYGNGTIISFYRKYKGKRLLIIHNLDSQVASFQLANEDMNLNKVIFSTNNEKVSSNGFDLEGYSSIILGK